MSKYMMTVHLDPKEATLARVKRKLNLGKNQIDPSFGIVPIDPEQNLYAILVDDDVAQKLQGTENVKGP